MSQRWYLAHFEKQLTGSDLGGKNCQSASGAMLADQFTLGLVDPTPDSFRRATGDTVGGVGVVKVGDVLENHYNVGVTTYDNTDGYTFDRLIADLRLGKFAVVNGDYDQVPVALRGDKDFLGPHSEYWQRVTASGIVVGDPLNDGRRAGIPDGYVTYPFDVARRYVEKLDRAVAGNGIMAITMDRRRLKARAGITANVRAGKTRSSAVLGQIKGDVTLVWGAKQQGESIGGNSVWFRVWHPGTAKVAFMHSSVVTTI